MNAVEIEAAISDLAFERFDAAEFAYAFWRASGCLTRLWPPVSTCRISADLKMFGDFRTNG